MFNFNEIIKYVLLCNESTEYTTGIRYRKSSTDCKRLRLESTTQKEGCKLNHVRYVTDIRMLLSKSMLFTSLKIK